MSYLNSVTIVGFVGADPEQRQARNNGSQFTVLSVATQRSWKTQKTNGSRKSSGIASRYFAPGWLRLFSTTSRKALTCSSKAALLARPTSRRMAKARRPRLPRSLRGRFAPMLCASSTAASQNRKHQRPVLTLPFCRPMRATRLRSDSSLRKALRPCRRAFSTFHFCGSVRRFARSRSVATQLKGRWAGRRRDVGKTLQQRIES
jgi:hypothetical protein